MSESELIVGQGLKMITAGENSERMSGDLWGQISVAKSFPRSIEVFRRKVEADICCSAQQAAECTYLIKRGQKDLEGPSVRFAEALLRAWGNVRVNTEIADDTGTHIVARARFWDLESNMAFSEDVFRRITNTDGKRYGDDMIGTTKNAAQAIAFRNVVLAGIPKSEWVPLHEKSIQLAKNGPKQDPAEFEKRKAKLFAWFRKAGVTDKELQSVLGSTPEECSTEDFLRLEKIGKSIHEGFSTFEEAFGREESEPQQQTQQQNGKASTAAATNGAGAATGGESKKWTVAELSDRFSKENADHQASAIVLAINAASLGDISPSEFKQLAVDRCGHDGDVGGQLLLDLLNATTVDSCSTVAGAVHAAKTQKKIGEDLHKSLSGLIARRMRELKGKK
jgi:hypothetical protein